MLLDVGLSSKLCLFYQKSIYPFIYLRGARQEGAPD